MAAFDPTQFGAVPVAPAAGGSQSQGSFDPAKMGAVPVSLNMPATDSQPQQGVGAVSSFLKSALMSTGAPQIAATVKQGYLDVKDISHQLFNTPGLTDEQQQELATEKYNLGGGVLGNDKVQSLQNPWQSAGTGASMASFMVPELKAEKGLSWAWNLLKTSAPFAITQTIGGISNDIGEGKKEAAVLTDAAVNYIGSVAGMGIFKGLGAGLKSMASHLMNSEVVKSANMAVLDFMNRSLSLDGRFAADGNVSPKDAALQTKALTQQYQAVHKQAMDAFSDAVQTPTTWGDAWRGIQSKVSDYFDGMVKAKDAKYSSVFTDTMIPNPSPSKGSYAPAFDALERAKAVTGEGAIPESGKMTPEEFNRAQGAIGKQDSPLAQYVSLVQSKLGSPDAPNALSMKDFDQLFTSAPLEADPRMNKAITDVQTSLYDAAKEELSKSNDPDAKETLQAWGEARSMWQNTRAVASNKFFGSIRGIGDGKEIVEKMITSRTGPSITTQKVIDGMDSDTRQAFSDIIYNSLLQRTRTMSTDYGANGRSLDAMLDRWVPTGIISPDHEMVLRSYAQAMQGTYDDAAQMIRNLVSTPGESPAGSAAETKAADSMTQAQSAQEKSQAAAGIEKAMGGRPLYTVNPDGTYDMSNLQSMLDKVNKGGENGELSSLQQYLSQIHDIESTSGSKIAGGMKLFFGATLFHQHPFVALGLISSGLDKFIGKDAEKATNTDLANLTSDLMNTGRLDPKGFTRLASSLLVGDYDTAGAIIRKAFVGATTETVTSTVNPPPESGVPDWFSSEFRKATGTDATPDHWDQFQPYTK